MSRRELAHRAGMPGPDGGPPEKYGSLELVKGAIRNKGFIGVKVYNTLGYRPLGNAEVDEEGRRIFHRNKMDRYAEFQGEEFDAVLSELYEFCVQEQVPITAHCNATGVEAYPGASHDFARPSYWREVLKRFPELHVNLAHFGWNRPEGYYARERGTLIRQSLRKLGETIRSRFPEMLSGRLRRRRRETWVGEICEMLEKYHYLFADVAHHGVTEDKNIAKYKASYKGMCGDFPGVIQRKLLFGIDWHVITRAENYRSFKGRYVQVLGDGGPFSDDEIAGFLGGNALHFLGLLPLETAPEAGWTGNRVRLQGFYRSNNIAPPEWFTSTA